MTKKLCDLKKLLKSDPARFMKHVSAPTHVCTTCGRVANKKKRLCEPKKLKS